MGFLAETVRRAGYLLRKFRFDRELDEEIHFHIESRACELEAMGLSAGEALTQARREFGSDLRMRENTRSTWQVGWVEDLLSDLRYAVRSFRRNPTFAFTAIVCLALGIGANTTIFSLSMEMLFSRPSSRNPQRLVQLWVGGSSAASMRDYRFIRDSRLFDGLAGENEETEVNWREGSESRRLHTVVVTDNFFDVIGIPVAIGRPIEPREPDAVVITHGFWQRALGGDPNVVGRKLTLDGKPYTVSGVLPADHRTVTGFGFSPDLYLPVTSENAQVTLYARLPDWMTRQTAYAALKAVCQELDRTYPHGDKQWARAIRVLAVSGVDRFDNDEMVSIAAFFAMLLAVVWFVLLVACANVASMLLARGSSRAHELAVRFSLGASRSRIIRQLLAETLLLALCGTAAGLILNVELSSALSRVHLPLPVPFQLVIRPDLRLLWYSLAVSIACTLFAGLIPALKGARAGLNAALKKSRNQGGRSHMRLRNF
ncbi:MAG TPA: ABC transporter permease, partial [Blastocatellia bacterium]|nr:ABC transporter permease [Blastocatellia bacterium]